MDSVRVCPKCGSGQKNDVIGAMRRPMIYRVIGLRVDRESVDQFLLRTCTRCSYQWEEACLDEA